MFLLPATALWLAALASSQDFLPSDLPGSVLWLDGNDPDGDFVPGGGLSGGTDWIDKSAAGGAHARQLFPSFTPLVVPDALNGRSVLRFDGDDYMDVSQSGLLNDVDGATVFAVLATAQRTGPQRVFTISIGTEPSFSARAAIFLFETFGTPLAGAGDFSLAGRRLDTDPFQRIDGGALELHAFESVTAVYDYGHGSITLFQDGSRTTTSPFQTPGHTSATDSLSIRVGADSWLEFVIAPFLGDLAELLVYDRALLDSERQQVEAYLQAKWFCTPTAVCDPLHGDRAALSLAAGGTQELTLDAGPGHAFGLYSLLTTSTGTSPGIPLAGGLAFPLNVSGLLLFTAGNPNLLVQNSLDFLDAAGVATASLSLAPGLDPSLAGVTLHHAYSVLALPTLDTAFVSNPIPLALLP